MPARKTESPWAFPRHLTSRFGRFPQRKVFWVVTIRIYPFAHTCQHVFEQVSRKLPISGKAFDIIIDVAIDLVGNALRQQAFDDSNHLRNMVCGSWKDLSRKDIKCFFILVKCVSIE